MCHEEAQEFLPLISIKSFTLFDQHASRHTRPTRKIHSVLPSPRAGKAPGYAADYSTNHATHYGAKARDDAANQCSGSRSSLSSTPSTERTACRTSGLSCKFLRGNRPSSPLVSAIRKDPNRYRTTNSPAPSAHRSRELPRRASRSNAGQFLFLLRKHRAK